MSGVFAVRAKRLLAAVVAAVALAAACGGDDDDTAATTSQPATGETGTQSGASDWDAVLEAANEEGSVTLYSTQVLPILEDLEVAFEDTYPDIDLVVVRGLPQDLIPKLEAERQTGNAIADVYVSADYQNMLVSESAGHYVPPVGPSFDSDDYDRETNVSEGGLFLSHAVVFGWAWNTEEVPDGLDGYEDLLDPELANGRVGVVEASNQALVDFWMYLERELGEDFVQDLATQEPRIYAGGSPLQEALASGEIAATVYAGAAMDDAVAAGAPVDWEVPDTPWGARYWGAVLDIAPNPNAAQVLADFFVTTAGQEVVARGNASTLPDIPGTRAIIEDVPVQDIEQLTPDFVSQYGEQWRSVFQ